MSVVGQTLPPLAQRAGLFVALLFALVVGVALQRRSGHRPVAALRRRLLLGVPWGTLVSAGVVIGVYLFLQGGWSHWYDPVVVPFRAWSYLSPLGVAAAGFSHAGPGHLIGNLVGTLTLAPLVEYAWGHYPEEHGTHLFGRATTNPYVRAFLLFPAAVVAVGVATAAFALGPVVGFSGVVFAFAGFALVYYPLSTVAALTAADGVRLAYRAFQQPSLTASGRPAFVTPWWADVAIQGHALGLVGGIVLAGWLARRRRASLPTPGRLLVGAALVAVGQNLWAVYWFLGGGEYVLFRAVGLALVAVLAVLVAAVAADGEPVAPPSAVRADGGGSLLRPAAVFVLLLVVAVLAGAAVPTNLIAVGDEELPGNPVEVREYTVTYAEDVPDGMVSVVDVSAFGLTTNVNTSGVIVRNPRRNVWTTAVSKGRLAFAGQRSVVVGGVGWREEVTATRRGFSAVGGRTAYRVTVGHDGTERLAFRSEPARAEPRVAGWNVSVVPAETEFRLRLSRDNETVSTVVPSGNQSVTAGEVRFVRDGRAVFALVGDNETVTRVRVAAKETYRETDET